MPASPVPVRTPSGATTDPPYGPLADSGFGNPFFYHQFSDDFDNMLGATGLYTLSGTGSVVHTPGDGGLALFSTTATANAFESIQLPAASFQLPQSTQKKLFFLTRLQLSDVTNTAMIAGLCDITATPFASITDGIWFSKASGGTVLNINTAVGGTTVTTAIPTSAYSLVAATNIDLGFYFDRNGYLNAFVGSQLVGYLPQSGTGSVNTAGVSVLPVLGRCLQITAPTVTTAYLSPTLGVQTSAAAIKTMTVDFWCTQKER